MIRKGACRRRNVPEQRRHDLLLRCAACRTQRHVGYPDRKGGRRMGGSAAGSVTPPAAMVRRGGPKQQDVNRTPPLGAARPPLYCLFLGSRALMVLRCACSLHRNLIDIRPRRYPTRHPSRFRVRNHEDAVQAFGHDPAGGTLSIQSVWRNRPVRTSRLHNRRGLLAYFSRLLPLREWQFSRRRQYSFR